MPSFLYTHNDMVLYVLNVYYITHMRTTQLPVIQQATASDMCMYMYTHYMYM